MIYIIICDYCGVSTVCKESDLDHISGRCVICKSKKRIQKHEPIDTYKDCPPFAKKVPIEAPSPDYGQYGSYGPYGDIYEGGRYD